MPKLDRFTIFMLCTLFLAGEAASAQSYADTERVTAIDLAVELRSASQAEGRSRKPPGNLVATDFQILVDGQQRPIVALAPVSESSPQPYRIVIYVDPELIDSRELQCSMDLLLSMTAELIELGSIDFVFATPEPRFLLRGVSNPEDLENLLASSTWKEEAGDQIRALRAGFVEALADIESDFDLQDLQNAFIEEEERLVQERLDLLLSFLADREVTGRQRALLLVGMQFDLDPSAFYSSWVDGAASLSHLSRSMPASNEGERRAV